MGTTWIPEPRMRPPRVWLLDNGQLIEEPELEMSSSGRRVRIKDRQETSVYAKERDAVIEGAVEEAVKRTGSDILTCLNKAEAIATEDTPLEASEFPKLGNGFGSVSFRAKWLFRHPSLPLTATITVTLRKTYRNYEIGSNLSFDQVSQQSRHQPSAGSLDARNGWSTGVMLRHWSDEHADLRHQLEARGLHEHFKEVKADSEREAVYRFKERIEAFENWATVAIPDVRDVDHVKWLDLDFVDSSVTGQFMADLADYLDSQPIVDKVAEKYEELRELMRYLGIVMEERSSEDFQRAVATSGSEALRVKVEATDANERRQDGAHSVYLHLMTGTISVECSSRVTDPDEASDNWKLARFEAEVNGELDAFLTHYRSLSNDNHRHSVINLINTRQGK